MMEIQKHVDVRLVKKRVTRKIDVVQFDTCVQLVFTVLDFEIPEGTVATLYAQKPSGKFVYQEQDITIADNTITVDLHNQVLTEHGSVPYQVRLMNGEDLVSTFTGWILVEKSLADAEAVESETVISAFDEKTKDCISDIQAVAQMYTADIASAREAADNANAAAEYAREVAEDIQNGGTGGGGSGGGSGTDGEDGGYYIPTVDENGVLSWTASKDDMPDVADANIKGKDGEDGQDGVSPVVAVTDIDGGHQITVTDANGAKTVNVMDGADGEDGTDAVSPTVNTEEVSGGHKVTITDVNGQKSFTVLDGTNGGKGDDGVSPTVAVSDITGGHKITITDAHGTKTVDVMDGSNGKDGSDGLDGNGIKSAVLNADYTLTLTFDDGTSYTTPSIRGATGSNGKDGAAGAAGKDGERGTLIHKVNSAPVTYSTTVDGYTPQYRIAISTVLAGSGLDDVKAGDIVWYANYHYPVGRVDATYAYLGMYVSHRGTKGDTGETGAAGVNGVGISTVQQTTTTTLSGGENIITVRLTNGSTEEFSVYNGAKGDKGDPYTLTEADKDTIAQAAADIVDVPDAVRYTAQTLTEAQKAQARANIGAADNTKDVEFAESAEWLDENGDTSKRYVLPDGFIYTYTTKYVYREHNANDGTGYLNANATGTWGDTPLTVAGTTTGMWASPLIRIDTSVISPVGNPAGSRCVISGLDKLVKRYYGTVRVIYYTSDGTQKYSLAGAQFPEIGDVEETALPVTFNLKTTTTFNDAGWANIYAVRIVLGISAGTITADDIANLKVNIPALNVNEEVTGWFSTGISFVQSDNSAAIAQLQRDVDTLMGAVGNSSAKSDTVWYAIGDSITAGYGVGLENAWYTRVKEINGYADASANLGVSSIGFVREDLNYGKTIRNIVDENSFANCDLVTVAVGINDWTEQCAMDDVKSEMRYCFNKIMTDNPYCKIIFLAPFNTAKYGTVDTNWAMEYSGGNTTGGTLKQFIDAQKTVCEEYGVQVIDLTDCGVINRYNIQTVLYDNLHPNADCHMALGKELARRIMFA